jgi:hypothetical protein
MRQTDAELWARFAEIEEQFRDRDDDERDAALEVSGDIHRTGEYRQGRPVFRARWHARGGGMH